MAESRHRDDIHIFLRHMITPLRQRPDTGGSNQRLSGTRRRAVADIPRHIMRCMFIIRMRCQHHLHQIIAHILRYRNLRRGPFHLKNLRPRNHLLNFGTIQPSRTIQNQVHLRMIRQSHRKLKKEAVQLRFRQRVGSIHFDRILRGEHKIGTLQPVTMSADRHGLFLHRFEQRRLRFRRGAVNFVRQQNVGKNGAPLEFKTLPARVVHQNIGPQNIGGQQVWRKLNPLKIERHHLRQRMHQCRLTQSRNPFEQNVTAGNHCHQHLFDNLFLTHDKSADLLLHQLKPLRKALNSLLHTLRLLHYFAPYFKVTSDKWRETRDEW